eukprot:COSAG03_NODE_4913_length_1395_cov_9.254630_1_plen_111_part_10
MVRLKKGRKGGKEPLPEPEPEPELEPQPQPQPQPQPDAGATRGPGGAIDELFTTMMAPVQPKLTDSMAAAVEAVRSTLSSTRGDTDFKASVALLKEAIASDKKGRKQEAAL